MKDTILDVTAVVVNWLSATNTLHAIQTFRKFYPDIPLIIVDDDSKESDRSEFYGSYNGHQNAPDITFDPDIRKLKNIDNHTMFVQIQPHKHYGKGEGNAIDSAMYVAQTNWMFHFHSDYRFLKGGIIEYLLSKTTDKVCAVGEDKRKHPDLPALSGVVELVNITLGKQFNLSYKPVIYHPDGKISPYPESLIEDGMPIAAGGYYTGKLSQLGYEVVTINGLAAEYGVHLRYGGEEWNKYY